LIVTVFALTVQAAVHAAVDLQIHTRPLRTIVPWTKFVIEFTSRVYPFR
jgi:hypothetical protein